MNLESVVGGQANLSARNVARVDHPEFVTRAAAESVVTQFEGLVIERSRVVPPGNTPSLVPKIDERRSQKGRVLIEACPSNQVRLAQQIAQVIVITAGPGVGLVHDGLEPL